MSVAPSVNTKGSGPRVDYRTSGDRGAYHDLVPLSFVSPIDRTFQNFDCGIHAVLLSHSGLRDETKCETRQSCGFELLISSRRSRGSKLGTQTGFRVFRQKPAGSHSRLVHRGRRALTHPRSIRQHVTPFRYTPTSTLEPCRPSLFSFLSTTTIDSQE
ncbi:hypothetical protein AG1IA_07911 [Rhizoctonia solani AG-1 IA]|uniref:Uncharacterized protein n=1 Tax=Thanatephorus cucumeris (strain AG1-IA) TaxID=983506 RepID=L8WNZ8_THACA|nr:hypothetical protein AG1IA_07911 [Rhizoctonia solani AG-1 IA]